jgi:hypothetical protein
LFSEFEKYAGLEAGLHALAKVLAAIRRLKDEENIRIGEELIKTHYTKIVAPEIERVTSEARSTDEPSFGYWQAVVKMFSFSDSLIKEECRKHFIQLVKKLIDELSPAEREQLKNQLS